MPPLQCGKICERTAIYYTDIQSGPKVPKGFQYLITPLLLVFNIQYQSIVDSTLFSIMCLVLEKNL